MKSNPKIRIERYHDISCGHRVVGHESKCRFLHGHNYRITFTCEANSLDSIGRVVDFSALKFTVCKWLEDNWDHKFLVWKNDHLMRSVYGELPENGMPTEDLMDLRESIVFLPFNPTAENMAEYLLNHVAPSYFSETGIKVVAVKVEETRKCSAIAELI